MAFAPHDHAICTFDSQWGKRFPTSHVHHVSTLEWYRAHPVRIPLPPISGVGKPLTTLPYGPRSLSPALFDLSIAVKSAASRSNGPKSPCSPSSDILCRMISAIHLSDPMARSCSALCLPIASHYEISVVCQFHPTASIHSQALVHFPYSFHVFDLSYALEGGRKP